jgi:hypothetical protein
LLVDPIDLFCFLLHLPIFLLLAPDPFLHLVQYATDRKIYLPKDSLKQRAIDINNNEVHQHEESNDEAVQVRVLVAVIIDNFGPGSLGEDLHHDVL